MVQRMRLHAEAAGFDSLASHSRVEAIAMLAVVDGELEKAIEVLDRGAVDVPPRAVARNRRWLAVFRAGLALEAGDLAAAANHVADAKPPNAGPWWECSGSTCTWLPARVRWARPGPACPSCSSPWTWRASPSPGRCTTSSPPPCRPGWRRPS